MATDLKGLLWENKWADQSQGPVLLPRHFSRVRLCAAPQTAARQAPLSLGFSRQKYWNGLPFPSPMHENEIESEVAQSCPTLSDSMDCSLPGSSIHGVFQARVLEWGAMLARLKDYKIANKKEVNTKQNSITT